MSKNEAMNYLNEKVSYKDIENILKEKMERDLNSKFEELFQKF